MRAKVPKSVVYNGRMLLIFTPLIAVLAASELIILIEFGCL